MRCSRTAKLSSSALCLLGLIGSVVSPAWAGSKGDAVKGKEVFTRATCAVCHADGGNKFNPSKPIKGAAFAKKYGKDEDLEKAIRDGVKGTAMQGFGKDKVSDAEMKDLIAYIRTLK